MVTAFLMPVIPLRELLEENSAGLAGCKALCDLLPFHVLCGLRHGVGATFLGGAGSAIFIVTIHVLSVSA